MNPPRDGNSSKREPTAEAVSTRKLPDRSRPSALPPKRTLADSAAQRRIPPTVDSKPDNMSQASAPLMQIEDFTPREWRECFDNATDLSVVTREGVWRVYDAGLTPTCDVALIFLHGGGHCALSWALVAQNLKKHVPVIAFDARGHGYSRSENDADLSSETQVADAAALINAFFAKRRPDKDIPRLVICGHSMGGAIAIRLSAAKVLPQVVGLIVIDVVEGTAMSALPYMSSWLRGRPSSFSSVEGAVRYVKKAGHVRNTASARLSVPAQVIYNQRAGRWVWRTDLEQSEQYWKGWFQGLSPLFLSVPAAKLLVLASVDRLDRDLMIAQMQGKFQNILIPAAGHAVHEDQPDQTAQAILEYLQRNLFVSSEADDDTAIFQQRRPIPPCC